MWSRLTKKDFLIAFLLSSTLLLIGWVIMPKPKTYKPTNADLEWLATNSGFIQGHMSVADNPLILDEWQDRVINDESKFISALKTRQCGFSFGVNAARALAKSILVDRNTSVFVSVNLDDAKEKIRYARDLYDSIPRGRKYRLLTDNKMQLEFANGSRIVTMFMPRGKGPADVYIDEMAFMKRAREIYRAAIGMTVRGGQIIIGSTPLAKAGLFYEIITNDRNAFKGYNRYSIPWWESAALCKNVARAMIEAPSMTSHERVYAFGTEALISLYENTYLEDFRQEFELSFMDDQQAFFPIELIFSCIDPELKLYETFEDFRANLKGVPYAGFDVGRRKNPSVLAILELLGEKYYLRMLIPMHKMDFDTQKFKLSEALRILPIPRMCIDETGLGMNLAEDLAKQFPHIVMPVNFAGRVDARTITHDPSSKKPTIAVKERMATDVKILMERNQLGLVQDRELINEFHSIKKEVTDSGNVNYAVEKNDQHHGDKFWAVALAVFGPGVYRKRAGVI